MRDELKVLLRVSLSLVHIQSAARLARHCWNVEEQFSGTYNEELNAEDKAFSAGAIMSSASFLEATVNELFNDAAESPNGERFRGVAANLVTDLARYVNNRREWNRFKDTKNNAYRAAGTYGNEILNKYQFAAVSLGRAEMVESDAAFLDARLLIDMRNKIVHYEPETVAVFDSEGPVPVQALAAALNGRFGTNPFAGAGGHNIFPSLYLSHGAAEWSVHVSLAFVDTFFAHTGLPRPYDHVRANCQTR